MVSHTTTTPAMMVSAPSEMSPISASCIKKLERRVEKKLERRAQGRGIGTFVFFFWLLRSSLSWVRLTDGSDGGAGAWSEADEVTW